MPLCQCILPCWAIMKTRLGGGVCMVVRNLLANQFIYLIARQWLAVLDAASHLPEGIPALGIMLRGDCRLCRREPVEQPSQHCIWRRIGCSRRCFQSRVLF